MTKPVGNLLGKWERSNRRIWQRIPIWFIAFIGCCVLSFNGLLADSSIPSGQPRTSLLISLVPFSIIFCPGFFALFLVDIALVFSVPEGTLEVYTDGFIRARRNTSELAAYLWSEVTDCTWQSEFADYLDFPDTDYSDAMAIATTVGSRITNRGYRHGDALTCKIVDNYQLKIDATYDNVESLVQVLWVTLIEYWTKVAEGKIVESGGTVYFNSIEIGAEWIRQGRTKVFWQNLEFASMNSRFTIGGRTEQGRLTKFQVKPTMKNLVLFSIANRHIPKVLTEDSLEDGPIN